jgi:uncharacterized protein (DUF58 family)
VSHQCPAQLVLSDGETCSLDQTDRKRRERPGVIPHACNPSTGEADEFKASYKARLYLKKKKKKYKKIEKFGCPSYQTKPVNTDLA